MAATRQKRNDGRKESIFGQSIGAVVDFMSGDGTIGVDFERRCMRASLTSGAIDDSCVHFDCQCQSNVFGLMFKLNVGKVLWSLRNTQDSKLAFQVRQPRDLIVAGRPCCRNP